MERSANDMYSHADYGMFPQTNKSGQVMKYQEIVMFICGFMVLKTFAEYQRTHLICTCIPGVQFYFCTEIKYQIPIFSLK